MSAPPLIAVVAYHLAPGRVTRWPDGGYGVPGPYLDALRRAGAGAVLLPPGEPGDPDELLAPFDGLLLVGGGDVDPARYGGANDGHVYGVEEDRDELELSAIHAADEAGMPVLCICRGLQVMNVAFGGTLHPHLPDLEGTIEHGVPVADEQTVHEVALEEASRLGAAVGAGSIACSSHHHQGVDRVGDGLRPTAWSEDGLVEGLEREGDTWFVGVQWHPEDTAATDPRQQALFDTFVRVVEAVE
ncbi:MAG TPA: gamma-glutamyl-gamma-aminobutyrate hydrolase family protein [Myxococcaceae bacterium]